MSVSLTLGQLLPGAVEATPPKVVFPYAPTAVQKRAMQPLFIPTWSIQTLLPSLPLLFPVDPSVPPSPKTRYRSHYRYLGPEALLDKTYRATLSDFEIALHVIDFSPLERVLAQMYVDSRKGQAPFHPVSMFLCVCLRREQNLSWNALAKLLAGDNGAGWRTLFGFEQGNTPCASGLRYFFNKVGPEVFDELCPLFIKLLRQHGLLPERSTYPGDPPDRGITVTQDGQLHPARSRPSCQLATDSCYEPIAQNQVSAPITSGRDTTSPTECTDSVRAGDEVQGKSGRPCRAREKGLPGCACDGPECQERCKRASALDPKARFIHYDGDNKRGNTEGDGGQDKAAKAKGVDIFGYRSIANRILDDRFAIAWSATSSLYSANTDERTVFLRELIKLRKLFPDLKIGEWLDDAGIGYEECLNAIWDLGALRMVDIRAHENDKDPEKCLQRGYDGQGRPLCPHGYVLHPNGYDNERRRAKYVCRQECRRKPLREGEEVHAVQGCPYLEREGSLGYIVNVGRAFADGSVRLAREIPYGSEAWDARYGRRNMSESRNGQMDGMGLKRMKSYGTERDTKDVQVADFLMDLRTLGRLVREATNLAQS